MIRCVIIFWLLPFICFSQNYGYFAGARSASLAHSTTALSDVWSSFHNQAGLAILENPSVAISYSNKYFIKELSTNALAVVIPSSLGNIGTNVTYFGFEDFNHTKIAINYSRKFGKRLAIGSQINYHHQTVAESGIRRQTLSLETGLIVFPILRLELGLHLFNPTQSSLSELTEEKLPSYSRLGALYHFSKESFVTAQYQMGAAANRFSAGFEYSILKFLALRTGIEWPLGNTFGIGLTAGAFRSDFSYEYQSELGHSGGISISYEFK